MDSRALERQIRRVVVRAERCFMARSVAEGIGAAGLASSVVLSWDREAQGRVRLGAAGGVRLGRLGNGMVLSVPVWKVAARNVPAG